MDSVCIYGFIVKTHFEFGIVVNLDVTCFLNVYFYFVGFYSFCVFCKNCVDLCKQ